MPGYSSNFSIPSASELSDLHPLYIFNKSNTTFFTHPPLEITQHPIIPTRMTMIFSIGEPKAPEVWIFHPFLCVLRALCGINLTLFVPLLSITTPTTLIFRGNSIHPKTTQNHRKSQKSTNNWIATSQLFCYVFTPIAPHISFHFNHLPKRPSNASFFVIYSN